MDNPVEILSPMVGADLEKTTCPRTAGTGGADLDPEQQNRRSEGKSTCPRSPGTGWAGAPATTCPRPRPPIAGTGRRAGLFDLGFGVPR